MSNEYQPKRYVLPVESWANVWADVLAEVRDGDTIYVRNEAQFEAVRHAVEGRNIQIVRHRFERFQAGKLDNSREVAERLYRKLTGKEPNARPSTQRSNHE